MSVWSEFNDSNEFKKAVFSWKENQKYPHPYCIGCIGCDNVTQPSDCAAADCPKRREMLLKIKKGMEGGNE